jgi:hypothetical protein
MVKRIPTIQDPTEQKDEIVLSFVLAIAAVEVFVNLFFRLLVTEAHFQQFNQLVLDDLDTSQPSGPKGLDHKLRHWPPKVLGKSLIWQKGVAKTFDEVRERRNALMHFTSSHQSIAFSNVTIQGLADTTTYDSLDVADAIKALEVSEGMVAELLRLRGISEAEIPRALHQRTGKVPI